MYYIYIIKSLSLTNKFYVGYTSDIQARIDVHNKGGSIYTKDYCPWILIFSCQFHDKLKALEFEKYLKSHSGRAFMQKRSV